MEALEVIYKELLARENYLKTKKDFYPIDTTKRIAKLEELQLIIVRVQQDLLIFKTKMK